LGALIKGVTGEEATKDWLKEKAKKITDCVRKFNLREGLNRDDEKLPKRLHKAIKKTGQNITEEEINYMLEDYYRIRGWDESGQVKATDKSENFRK